MAIYDKPVRLLMRDMVSELALAKGHVVPKDRILAWFGQRYPRIKKGTVSAHLTLLSTNAPSRVHHNAKPDDDLFYQLDGSNFRLYEPSSDPAPIYPGGGLDVTAERGAPDPTTEPPGEFAYESDLRDFLSRNLALLEPGVRLYQEESIRGIEFPAGGRFIDILAVDRQNNLVVH